MFLPRNTIKMTGGGGGCDATCWIRAAQKHPPPHQTRTERVRGMQNSAGEKKQNAKPKTSYVNINLCKQKIKCYGCTTSDALLQHKNTLSVSRQISSTALLLKKQENKNHVQASACNHRCHVEFNISRSLSQLHPPPTQPPAATSNLYV